MYCIKVPEGRERKVAGDYPYAFLPSYTYIKPLNPEKTEFGTERRLIVPGYIFTIRNERTAEHVPGGEWRIIEALSDPNPSFMNEEGQIVSGPLAEYNHLVTDIKDDNVRIQASLLEQDRIYWIRVRKAAEEPVSPKAEEPAPQTPDTEKKPALIVQETAENKKEHTQEQKEQILAEAEKVGIHAAGKSAGIPWQTVMRWAREAGRQIPSKAKKPIQSPDLYTAEIENANLKKKIALLEEEIRKLQSTLKELTS